MSAVIAAADARLDKALDACSKAEAEAVAAALHLMVLRAREDHPAAVAVRLSWSDQGDFPQRRRPRRPGRGGPRLVRRGVPGVELRRPPGGPLACVHAGLYLRDQPGLLRTSDRADPRPLQPTGGAVMSLRERIDHVLDEADLIEAAWVEANEEADGAPSAKAWEGDDDARRLLSYDAVDVLRELLTLVEKGEDLGLTPAAPELLFMVWDGGAAEESFEDDVDHPGVILDHDQTYSVCPRCEAVDGGIFEVDRCERWNEAEIHAQPDTIGMYGVREGHGWGLLGSQPNSLAGLPLLSIHQNRDSDFHTDRFACGACQEEITLPEWVETRWP